MGMQTSRYKEEMTLQRVILETDDSGGWIETWNSLGTLWVTILSISPREAVMDGVHYSSNRARFKVRNAPHGDSRRVMPSDRLLSGSTLWRVLSATEDGMGWLELLAEEVRA